MSIRDVAERANVSLGTVSNVLNHPEVVAEATRLRVLTVILTIRQCAERRLGIQRAITVARFNPAQAQSSSASEKCVEQLLMHGRKSTAAFCADDLLTPGKAFIFLKGHIHGNI